MNRIFVPTAGPSDWRRLLADPSRHWRSGRSALELAVCWEAVRRTTRGLPPEVAAVLDAVPEIREMTLLFAIPEHPVSFVGGGHASQTDLWALLKAPTGLVSMAVEGKAGEDLGKVVSDWLPAEHEKSGKRERLTDLKQWLDLGQNQDVLRIRYQLLHRTASALKEAERVGAAAAVMLVQSFNRPADQTSLAAFTEFGRLMGATVREDGLVSSNRKTVVPLWLGWVNSNPADAQRLADAI